MSAVQCPRCEGSVLLPPGAAPSARAKCPLCAEEYSLAEVFEKLPPMLVLLDVPFKVAVGNTASQGADAFEGLYMPGNANGQGELHLAPTDEEEEFSFGGAAMVDDDDTALATAPITSKGPLRPAKKPKSMAKEMVKIALGGVLGLAIGWYIVLWILAKPMFGSDAERKVIGYIPNWAKPAALASEKQETPSEEGEAKKPAGEGAKEPGDENTENADAEEPQDDGAPGDAASETGDGDSKKGDASADTTPNDSDASAAKTNADVPAETPMPEATKTDAAKPNDPGSEADPILNPVTPPTEIEVGEPKLEPLPEKKPAIIDEPEVSEPPASDPPASDPPASDPPVADPPTEEPMVEKSPNPPTIEPAPEDDPTAEKTPEVPAVKAEIGLKVETPVDPTAVAGALKAAQATTDVLAPEAEAAKSVLNKEKLDAYKTLCAAALSVAHASDENGNPAARALALVLTADKADATVHGQLANAWLSKKRPSDGIFLAGPIRSVEKQGDLTTLSIELPGIEGKLKAMTVTIVAPSGVAVKNGEALKAGDQVAVVGKVVEKAKDEIAGYEGENARAVWGAVIYAQ